MEDILREFSRNPIKSLRNGLNPYSYGRYTARTNINSHVGYKRVLILILMEDILRGYETRRKRTLTKVLILILMEDILREVNI